MKIKYPLLLDGGLSNELEKQGMTVEEVRYGIEELLEKEGVVIECVVIECVVI